MHTSPQEKLTTQTRTLYMALELSATTWKLAFSDRLCRRPRVRSIAVGDFDRLQEEIQRARPARPGCPHCAAAKALANSMGVNRPSASTSAEE